MEESDGLQMGPGGNLIDVSDKVNLRDLRPDQIGGIRTDDGRFPQSREAALRLLQEILPGAKLSSGLRSPSNATASYAVRRMEVALTESDKILEHWKK